VYLAGPITGLTYDDGQDWRDRARLILAKQGIDAYSPLRGKEYLRNITDRIDSGGTGSAYVGVNVLSDPKGIVARDSMDCMKRDVVLANLAGAERVSVGTCIEFGWANAARVPIVMVMERDGSNPHDHAMILELAGYHVETLEEALEVVAALLLP
jgi:nucleoside 2-deoxyribosyltransferase